MIKSTYDVVVIGAGQGGISTSYFLTQAGVDHVVLERGEIANAWIRDRWDSFCMATPNWTITLPGAAYAGPEPNAFMSRDDFVAHMHNWARSFSAPVRTGVDVISIAGEPGQFRLMTSSGPLTAKAVVVATATFQKPRLLPCRSQLSERLTQLQANEYRNPQGLPDGAVLVIGSAQSGSQITEELSEAGREVYLSVGQSGRLPRRYRGKDCVSWQREMGWLDRTPDFFKRPEDRFRSDPHLSGTKGGHTVSMHMFRQDGIHLIGRIAAAEGEIIFLDDDLEKNMRLADEYALNFYQAVDDHIVRAGLSEPDPVACELAGGPASDAWTVSAPTALDLKQANITSVIWATGFVYDFSWVEFPVVDAMGYPVTDHGATSVAGLYFNGLNWMTRRKSGIIYGVGEDARRVTEHIFVYLGGAIRGRECKSRN